MLQQFFVFQVWTKPYGHGMDIKRPLVSIFDCTWLILFMLQWRIVFLCNDVCVQFVANIHIAHENRLTPFNYYQIELWSFFSRFTYEIWGAT